jgi:hypothetical protein
LEQLPAASPAQHRAILALDIEQSTCRTDAVKAELRDALYELFEAALLSAGISSRHRDPFTDRGDGLLALIHPVRQAPKATLLNQVIPVFGQLLTEHNADLPQASRPQRQLRVRAVIHAGEVRYDAHGCFGEAVDIAFRLLDDIHVKKALQDAAGPLILVVSQDIYSSVVRQGYDGIDQTAFRPLILVQVAGNCHPGWINIPAAATKRHLIDVAHYRQPA